MFAHGQQQPVTRGAPIDVPPHIRAQAELELRRRYEPARTTLKGFITTTKSDMLFNWFHDRVCTELDQFVADVLVGRHPRLMLIAPPRHGKSEMVSRRLPAYILGKFPTWHVIACSYASDLAQRMNRDVQRVIDTDMYRRVFPETRLNMKNIATLSGQPLRNAHIFEVVKHLGSYRSAGVGEGIAGMGFDIGIIDDPVKDAQDANSERERDTKWEWYENVFYNRASPTSGILLVMTRWHQDDLAGRLLHKMAFEGGDQWRVVRFPAIAEHEADRTTDGDPRKEGDALHPERYPKERLEQIRAVSGSYSFGALFQGNPTPKGGGIVKREDFQFYRRAEIEGHPHAFFDLVCISVDAAFKDTINASYVVIQAWGRRSPKNYLLAQVRARLTFTRTVEALQKIRMVFANCNAVLIEDKANGTAIIDVLSKSVPGVIAIEPMGSKEARAEAVAPLIEAGNVILPHPDEQPWVEQFIFEWLSVPTGAFWDQVDACSQYLLRYGRTVLVKLTDIDTMISESIVTTMDSGSPWSM